MNFRYLIIVSALWLGINPKALQASNQQEGALFQKTVVYFGFDETRPIQKSAKSIEQVAKQLNERPNLSVRLIGYADPTGDEMYNLELSKQRAEACKATLIELGIEASRILIEARGEQAISDSETTLNDERRRVEIMPILLKN